MVRIPLLLLLSCISLWGFAQQYGFIPYSINEGLVQTQVRAIDQDDNGNLWIATVGGVSKFDGVDVTNYSKSDGLTANQVDHLLVDADNRVWMACGNDVSLIQGDRITNFSLPETYANYRMDYLYKEEDTIWCATRRHSLIKLVFDSEYTSITAHSQVGDSLRIRSILPYKGKLLAGSNKGLFYVQGNSILRYPQEKVDQLNISALFTNGSRLWVGTTREGVLEIDEYGEHKWYNGSSSGLENESVRSTWITEDGIIWTASKPGGARKLPGAETS